MEVEGEAAGGKVKAAHVGCFVFCVFCVLVASSILATKDTYFVES